MADTRIGSTPFFERGLESVVDTPEIAPLPDPYGLAPSAIEQPAALDAILHADNLESMLEVFVRPQLAELQLLTPLRFRAAMESLVAYLRDATQTHLKKSPKAGKTIDSAVDLLDNEIELRDLLQMYRSALLQG